MIHAIATSPAIPQRTAEAAAHRRWYEERAADGWRFVEPTQVNEGEGDFAYVPGVEGDLYRGVRRIAV